MNKGKAVAAAVSKGSKGAEENAARGMVTTNSGDELWCVEDIISSRTQPDGKVEYLLKWEGWTAKYNTWEPESQLQNDCPQKLQEFQRAERAAKRVKVESHPEKSQELQRKERAAKRVKAESPPEKSQELQRNERVAKWITAQNQSHIEKPQAFQRKERAAKRMTTQSSPEKKPQPNGAQNRFEVECITDKRVLSNKVEYNVKWVGWNATDNTWEPAAVMMEDCPTLVQKYETECREQRAGKRVNGQVEKTEKPASNVKEEEDDLFSIVRGGFIKKKRHLLSTGNANASGTIAGKMILRPKTKMPASAPAPPTCLDGLDGIALNLTAEKILGISNEFGVITFLVKWKNFLQGGMVPATLIGEKYPEMAIKFYETRIVWEINGREEMPQQN